MMNKPPIDELAKKTGGNKYLLCCLLSKEAKILTTTIPEVIEKSDKKAISLAADKIFEGKIVPSEIEE